MLMRRKHLEWFSLAPGCRVRSAGCVTAYPVIDICGVKYCLERITSRP